MAHSFVAFIDEAGDEGFNIVPRPDKKSSEWFIMSAVIVRANITATFDHRLVSFRAVTGRREFHFRDARHHDRVAFLDILKWVPFHIVSVAAHKPSLTATSTLSSVRHQLYHYVSKLLIERISWFCDDFSHPGAIATAKLIFAERGQLKEARILDHLRRLRYGITNHSIRWRVIDPSEIEIAPAKAHTGLQVADAAAGSLEQALELSRHSTTEHRYMKLWAHKYAKRQGKADGVSLKCFPSWPEDNPFAFPDRQHWRRHIP